MRILIDTNIILDLVQDREPYSENASKVINSCIRGEHKGYISSHSLVDLFFILRKNKTIEERKTLILNLCKFFTIIPEENQYFVSICNNHNWNDLEDGLQMKCAEAENLDYIITRDGERGFKNSPVKIINPEEGDVPKVGYFRDIPDEFKVKSLYSNDLTLNIASKSKETVQKLKFLDSPIKSNDRFNMILPLAMPVTQMLDRTFFRRNL